MTFVPHLRYFTLWSNKNPLFSQCWNAMWYFAAKNRSGAYLRRLFRGWCGAFCGLVTQIFVFGCLSLVVVRDLSVFGGMGGVVVGQKRVCLPPLFVFWGTNFLGPRRFSGTRVYRHFVWILVRSLCLLCFLGVR